MILSHIQRKIFYFSVSAFLLFSNIAIAQDPHSQEVSTRDINFDNHMTGDFGGARSKLLSKGVDFQVVYTADVFDNVSGGIKRGAMFMDNLDIMAEIDGEKFYGVKGSKIFFYFLNNNGGKFNEKRIGSNDGIDNIEVGTPAFKL